MAPPREPFDDLTLVPVPVQLINYQSDTHSAAHFIL